MVAEAEDEGSTEVDISKLRLQLRAYFYRDESANELPRLVELLQRQQVADSMSRYMGQLGLRREAKHPLSLEAYVAGKTRQRCTE